jgi:hypothetical protein
VVLYSGFGRPFIRKTHHEPLLPSLTRYLGEDSNRPAKLRKFTAMCHAPPRSLCHVPNLPAATSDGQPFATINPTPAKPSPCTRTEGWMCNAIEVLRYKADDCESQARAAKESLIKAELFDITALFSWGDGKALPTGIGNRNPSRFTYQRTPSGRRPTAGVDRVRPLLSRRPYPGIG